MNVQVAGDLMGSGYWEQEQKCSRCKSINIIRFHGDYRVEILLKGKVVYAAHQP